jgi:crossover junction endodeoxyribonuclease RusA
MLSRVAFTVMGEPQPQGSKTVIQQKGRRPRMIEDNPDTAPWRERVERAAREAMTMHGDEGTSWFAPPLTGAVELRVVFVFRRPAGHYGTGRNAGRLKPSSPLYVRTRPDVDKLLRAIGDALSGTVCRDDAQVVRVRAEKHYGEQALAHIVVEELALEDDRPLDEESVGG